jgi:hypothetical protein
MVAPCTADRRLMTTKTLTSSAQLMAIKPAMKEGEEDIMLRDHGAARVDTETCCQQPRSSHLRARQKLVRFSSEFESKRVIGKVCYDVMLCEERKNRKIQQDVTLSRLDAGWRRSKRVLLSLFNS